MKLNYSGYSRIYTIQLRTTIETDKYKVIYVLGLHTICETAMLKLFGEITAKQRISFFVKHCNHSSMRISKVNIKVFFSGK